MNMSYIDHDTLGIYRTTDNEGPGPQLMGADTLIGDDVYNQQGDELGEIKEIMLDMRNGRVAYAVLSFGGFLGMGEKLFAVPWNALTLDTENKRFMLNVDKERLKTAPGFDKDHWPNMADQTWTNEIHSYYGTQPYSSTSSGTTGTRM
jgi:sporulation protein YlmC with PRC-barrel domain